MFGQDKIFPHLSQELGSNLFHTVSTYGMVNQDQKSSGLLLACLHLLVTCLDIHTQGLASFVQNVSLDKNSFQII